MTSRSASALLSDLGSIAGREIHGQADDRGLFDPSTHRRLLDVFGGHEPLAREVAERFANSSNCANKPSLRRAAAANTAELDYLQHAVEELSDLAPMDGEEVGLADERALMMNANRIAEDVAARSRPFPATAARKCRWQAR